MAQSPSENTDSHPVLGRIWAGLTGRAAAIGSFGRLWCCAASCLWQISPITNMGISRLKTCRAFMLFTALSCLRRLFLAGKNSAHFYQAARRLLWQSGSRQRRLSRSAA